MKLEVKKYLLRLDDRTWIELEKYSAKHDLRIAQIIRKAIKEFLYGK